MRGKKTAKFTRFARICRAASKMGHARWASKTAAAGRRGVTSGGRGVPGARCTGWPRARRPSPARSNPPSPSAPPRSGPAPAPLRPQLALPRRLNAWLLALSLFGPAAQRQRRGGGRACRPVGAATVVAGVRPRRGGPCAAPPGGGPGAPALPAHPTARPGRSWI